MHSDVYVPRWHTELVAERAAERLPDGGVAIDLVHRLRARSPRRCAPAGRARGWSASDLDPNAVVNARANGVEAYAGDLFAPLPADSGSPTSSSAVVPYVPRRALPLLQRDTFRFETALAYDGGEEGLDILLRVLEEAPRAAAARAARWCSRSAAHRPATWTPTSPRLPYDDVTEITDEDGDLRGLELDSLKWSECGRRAVGGPAHRAETRGVLETTPFVARLGDATKTYGRGPGAVHALGA